MGGDNSPRRTGCIDWSPNIFIAPFLRAAGKRFFSCLSIGRNVVVQKEKKLAVSTVPANFCPYAVECVTTESL